MIGAHDSNEKVLKFLEKENQDARPLCLLPDELSVDPYWELGSHPEIVERLWDQINTQLPADCRAVIFGAPALIRPDTGLILALGIGTQYAVRLPLEMIESAIAAGAAVTTEWSDGGRLNVSLELGKDWIFGAWLDLEYDGINRFLAD